VTSGSRVIEAIEVTEREHVIELALRQPPMNEIGTRMLADLERCLELVRVRAPRVLIVRSALESGFCAGADLRELHAGIRGKSYAELRPGLSSFLDRIHAVMNGLDTLPCTTIGVITGACFGGGFELALTLDVLIAEPTARFCFPELRLGIVPGFGGIPRLLREAPAPVARDLLLSGRSLGAKRARELGLVSQVVARGEGLTAARALGAQSSLFEPAAVRAAKQMMKQLPEAALAREKQVFLDLFADPKVERALAGFVSSDDMMPYQPGSSAMQPEGE